MCDDDFVRAIALKRLREEQPESKSRRVQPDTVEPPPEEPPEEPQVTPEPTAEEPERQWNPLSMASETTANNQKPPVPALPTSKGSRRIPYLPSLRDTGSTPRAIRHNFIVMEHHSNNDQHLRNHNYLPPRIRTHLGRTNHGMTIHGS